MKQVFIVEAQVLDNIDRPRDRRIVGVFDTIEKIKAAKRLLIRKNPGMKLGIKITPYCQTTTL